MAYDIDILKVMTPKIRWIYLKVLIYNCESRITKRIITKLIYCRL